MKGVDTMSAKAQLSALPCKVPILTDVHQANKGFRAKASTQSLLRKPSFIHNPLYDIPPLRQESNCTSSETL